MALTAETLVSKLVGFAHNMRLTDRWGIKRRTAFHPSIVVDAIRCACMKAMDDYPRHQRFAFVDTNRLHPLHPAVEFLFDCDVLPTNWHTLALEWPHRATSDPQKLAYTRQEVDATRTKLPVDHPRYNPEQKHTVTTVTKYLKRHWPQLPDHLIQEVDARFNPRSDVRSTSDYREMIAVLGMGPRSCMHPNYGTVPFKSRHQEMAERWFNDRTQEEPDWDLHPYTVFRGENGWSLYYRVEGESVVARALVYKDPDGDDQPCWVRTYHEGGRDTVLEQWFDANGIVQRHSWPSGARLEAVPRSNYDDDEYMMPYLDGDDRSVEFCGDYFITGGDLSATETRGWISANDVDWECEDCGEGYSDEADEGTLVGRHEDRRVCGSCLDEYTLVSGSAVGRWSNYREYWVRDDYDVVVDDEGRETGVYVDTRNVPDNYVVCYDHYRDERYADIDDTVLIDGEYWPRNHRDVVGLNEERNDGSGETYALLEDTWEDGDGNTHHDDHDYIEYDGQKWMKEDAWQCEATGWWYPEHVDQAVDPLTGDTVHPSYLEGCNRDADFTIVYVDDTCNALPHIHVPTDSALVSDAMTSEVFALAA